MSTEVIMRSERSYAPVSSLIESLSRFTTMPSKWAKYDMSAETAATMLRCTPEDITQLVHQGLPHACSAQGPLFEYFDVMNVGRFSRTGMTTPELTGRTLMRFSSKPASAWLGDKEWVVKVRLPDEGSGRYWIRVPDFDSPGITRLDKQFDQPIVAKKQQNQSYAVAIRVNGAHDAICASLVWEVYHELLETLRSGEVTYQAVCEPLRAEHSLAWKLGMADCMVANRVLADRLRSTGFCVRARRGFILGLVGSEHAWCEVHEDGRWKNLDVTFAAMPSGLPWRQHTPEHNEFVAHCFGTRFNRCLPCVSDNAEPLMYDDTTHQPLSMIGVVSATERKR
jgi:hypothetical protein